MALIELATECFACDRLVICLERNAEGLRKFHRTLPYQLVLTPYEDGLVRDLGWVGFELITLAHWAQTDIPQRSGSNARCGSFSSVSTSSSVFSDDDITSEKWLFMGMEL
jgi:oligosaccharide translocation protein RFT1